MNMTKPFDKEGKMNFTDFSIISVDESVFRIEKVKSLDTNMSKKTPRKKRKQLVLIMVIMLTMLIMLIILTILIM